MAFLHSLGKRGVAGGKIEVCALHCTWNFSGTFFHGARASVCTSMRVVLKFICMTFSICTGKGEKDGHIHIPKEQARGLW